jgi:uncharacterized OB-fold protein
VPERRPNRVLGPADAEFWGHCAEGELWLQQCAGCSHISWPPAIQCERCGTADLQWQRVSGRGRVVSWCTFGKRYYDELPVPWDAILVELEEGPLFVSNPDGFSSDEIEDGMPVAVDFVEAEDEAGVFRLPVFRKAQSS